MATSCSLADQQDKCVNATKADESIYGSIVDILLFGDLPVNSSFSSFLLEMLAIEATGLASINVPFTFWLAYRLCLAIAALVGVVNLAHTSATKATHPPLCSRCRKNLVVTDHRQISQLYSVLPGSYSKALTFGLPRRMTRKIRGNTASCTRTTSGYYLKA